MSFEAATSRNQLSKDLLAACQILQEEFEVLESIFPDELEKLSESSLQIRVEPDEPTPLHPLVVSLLVTYPESYPDVLPDLEIEDVEGELSEEEKQELLDGLKVVGEESIGMAMVFTLTSALRESLGNVGRTRIRKQQDKDDLRFAELEAAEAARKRGTPVTTERFLEWRKKFEGEMRAVKDREEEERLKSLAAKEREEVRKIKARQSGRQLFEKNAALATSDEALMEDGVAEVDLAQYSREERERERRRVEEVEEEGHGVGVDWDSD